MKMPRKTCERCGKECLWLIEQNTEMVCIECNQDIVRAQLKQQQENDNENA